MIPARRPLAGRLIIDSDEAWTTPYWESIMDEGSLMADVT